MSSQFHGCFRQKDPDIDMQIEGIHGQEEEGISTVLIGLWCRGPGIAQQYIDAEGLPLNAHHVAVALSQMSFTERTCDGTIDDRFSQSRCDPCKHIISYKVCDCPEDREQHALLQKSHLS